MKCWIAMRSADEIGGYFGLEICEKSSFPFQDPILLNSARSCFEYILRSQKVSKVWLPIFTCDVMLEPLTRLNIDFELYSIDENLEIKQQPNIGNSDLLVYTNYFGIKDEYCREVFNSFSSNVVFDFSQSLFSTAPPGSSSFFSPRKFFGLPDGGILVSDLRINDELPVDKTSHSRMSHLLIREDEDAQAGFEDFKRNDASLSGRPMERMSSLTHKLLVGADFEFSKQRRRENFAKLHNELGGTNLMRIATNDDTVALCYPYWSSDTSLRQKLIDNRIYVPTYWPNVFEWCDSVQLEFHLASEILPLPIDHRYSIEDMNTILDVISV